MEPICAAASVLGQVIAVRPSARPRAAPVPDADRGGPGAHARRHGAGAAVGVVVVAVVAAVDPAGLAPFGPARWAVATTGVAALAAVVLGRRSRRPARRPTALFAAFLAWACVAAAAGLDPLYAWTGTPERHAGVLAWALCLVAFAVGQALRDDERRAAAVGVGVAAVAAGGWALPRRWGGSRCA